MTDFTDGVQFDPGFIQHISAFTPNIEYVYETLGRYRNFAQKKQQFKMFYPKILSLLENYLGFYLGCILWAMCIKKFDNKEILNNICYGGEYSEDETLSEVDFITNYIEQLKKDVKYYTGQNFSIDTASTNILDAYRVFLKENKGFVKAKTTNDIVIPKSFKALSEKDSQDVLKKIEEVIESGRLKDLYPLAEKVL